MNTMKPQAISICTIDQHTHSHIYYWEPRTSRCITLSPRITSCEISVSASITSEHLDAATNEWKAEVFFADDVPLKSATSTAFCQPFGSITTHAKDDMQGQLNVG
jgi:hypothetical protein